MHWRPFFSDKCGSRASSPQVIDCVSDGMIPGFLEFSRITPHSSLSLLEPALRLPLRVERRSAQGYLHPRAGPHRIDGRQSPDACRRATGGMSPTTRSAVNERSEEHTSELQSREK